MPQAAKRMLVIDDEEIVLESCRRIFSERGFEVAGVSSARQGLEKAAERHFDVILCDWKMPEMDGVDVVEILDKRSPDSTIVMITGFPSTERATDVMKRGAMDYVAKPFTPEEIVAAVDKAMSRKKVEAAKGTEKLEKAVRSLSFPVPAMDDQSPQTIAEAVSDRISVSKTRAPWIPVLVLGVLAGTYIAFGGMLSQAVSFDIAGKLGVGFASFMRGAVFSLGLMLVVIAGAELFTGNNLMVSGAMAGKITFGQMAERWVVVFFANFAGAVLMALLFAFSGLWKVADGGLGAFVIRVAYTKVNLGFVEALVRGIGCNWLVCLAVWMALAARQTIGKIFAIFFPIMAFVALGFEHSVANMYFVPVGLFLRSIFGAAAPDGFQPDSLTWLSFLWRNLLPVTIGNIIGGGVFVGMGYWGAYLRTPKESGVARR